MDDNQPDRDDERDPIEEMFEVKAGPIPGAADTTLAQDKELALLIMAAYDAAREAHAKFAYAQEVAVAQGRAPELIAATHEAMTYCDEADQCHYAALLAMGVRGEDDLNALVEGEGFNPPPLPEKE